MVNMNLQESFPETVALNVACELLGLSPYEIRFKVLSRQISSLSYEDINLKSIAHYLMEVKGWDQDYTELFIHQTLKP
jgi:hypothetical protein